MTAVKTLDCLPSDGTSQPIEPFHRHGLHEASRRLGSDVLRRQPQWVAEDTGLGTRWVGVQVLPCDCWLRGLGRVMLPLQNGLSPFVEYSS